ncbi:MAG: hypothetical protein ACM3RX_06760 [Methanococcaceae archaeon]
MVTLKVRYDDFSTYTRAKTSRSELPIYL